jgi:hypothetical protein
MARVRNVHRIDLYCPEYMTNATILINQNHHSGQVRAALDAIGRPGPPASGRDRHAWHHALAGGQSGNGEDPYRLRGR